MTPLVCAIPTPTRGDMMCACLLNMTAVACCYRRRGQGAASRLNRRGHLAVTAVLSIRRSGISASRRDSTSSSGSLLGRLVVRTEPCMGGPSMCCHRGLVLSCLRQGCPDKARSDRSWLYQNADSVLHASMPMASDHLQRRRFGAASEEFRRGMRSGKVRRQRPISSGHGCQPGSSMAAPFDGVSQHLCMPNMPRCCGSRSSGAVVCQAPRGSASARLLVCQPR